MPPGTTLPDSGLLRSVSKKESVETYSYRDHTGLTKVLIPGKVITTETTAEFYGSSDVSAVAAGVMVAGQAKIVSAKVSETNEGVPEGSFTTKTYSNI